MRIDLSLEPGRGRAQIFETRGCRRSASPGASGSNTSTRSALLSATYTSPVSESTATPRPCAQLFSAETLDQRTISSEHRHAAEVVDDTHRPVAASPSGELARARQIDGHGRSCLHSRALRLAASPVPLKRGDHRRRLRRRRRFGTFGSRDASAADGSHRTLRPAHRRPNPAFPHIPAPARSSPTGSFSSASLKLTSCSAIRQDRSPTPRRPRRPPRRQACPAPRSRNAAAQAVRRPG